MLSKENLPKDDLANFGQRGHLRARLAQSAEDLQASQRLRYKVFYQEMNAQSDRLIDATGLDQDRFDPICDHLLVINTTPAGNSDAVMMHDGELVGTYRLLRQEVAEQHHGFYTQGEFDIAPLLQRKSELRFLELGRSCVLAEHRSKPVVELLWQGIWNFVRMHQVDVMFGCASLEGTEIQHHSAALSFLAHHAQAPAEWSVRAVAGRYVDMKQIALPALDAKRALASLPPLIKGYLRLGCFIGDGAVTDTQFNTTDVLIILPVSVINPRYFERFGQPAPAA